MSNETLVQRVTAALPAHGVPYDLLTDIIEALRPPTDNEHEADAQRFVSAVDAILIDSLRLSSAVHPAIFERREGLRRLLRELLADATWKAHQAERIRVLDTIAKEIGTLR